MNQSLQGFRISPIWYEMCKLFTLELGKSVHPKPFSSVIFLTTNVTSGSYDCPVIINTLYDYKSGHHYLVDCCHRAVSQWLYTEVPLSAAWRIYHLHKHFK